MLEVNGWNVFIKFQIFTQVITIEKVNFICVVAKLCNSYNNPTSRTWHHITKLLFIIVDQQKHLSVLLTTYNILSLGLVHSHLLKFMRINIHILISTIVTIMMDIIRIVKKNVIYNNRLTENYCTDKDAK